MGLTLAPKLKNGPMCTLCTTLEALSPKDRVMVDAWLDDPNVQHAQISRSLRGEGYDVAAGTVSRHRNGECANGRCA